MRSFARICKGSANTLIFLCLLMLLAIPLTAFADEALDEDGIFASVRVYDGIEPADQDEIARQAAEGFLPIMNSSEGFVGYYLLSAEDGLVAISLFRTPEAASASTEAARDFVAENLAPLLPNPPLVVEGNAGLNYVVPLDDMTAEMDDESETEDEMMVAKGITTLYASVRIYTGFDMQHLDEANKLAETHLIPVLKEGEGYFGSYTINDSGDTVVAITIYESEEAALASHANAAAFVAEYIADWLPDDPLRINGRLAVAALAALHMGENLIVTMME